MAVSVMARGGFCVKPSSSCGPRRVAGVRGVPTSPFVRGMVRPLTVPRAFYRGVNSSGWDEEMAKEVMQDMAKMWKQAKESGMAGGFLWPGGGYMYSTSAGRCRPADASAAGSSAASSLALDLVATEDFYLVYADVPGLSKSDLTIKLSKERVLTVSGERRPPVDEGYQQKERRFGRFERAWTLPEDADSEGISAKVSEGVLTITVPKKQPEPVVDESSEIPIN